MQTTNANTDKEIWEITCGSNASSEADLIFQSRTDAGSGGSEGIRLVNGGAVELYHANEKKFVTQADGAKVQDLSGNTVELELTTAQGDGGSLYANTAASPSGTFGLTTTSGDWALKSHNNGSVELHYDGTKKIETTADGIAVTLSLIHI